MQIEKTDLLELISTVVKETIEQLGITAVGTAENLGKRGKTEHAEKSAYQKTEQLLYNYRGFKRIVDERMQEIEDLRKFGVPKRAAGFEYVPHSNVPGGIVLPEESVESAVANVVKSVEGTVAALALIDKCMASLKGDPYYPILEMRYFEGRTQEDIAVELGCAQKTISQNKSRLVKELSMRLFPDQVVEEMLH